MLRSSLIPYPYNFNNQMVGSIDVNERLQRANHFNVDAGQPAVHRSYQLGSPIKSLVDRQRRSTW